ncbi:glycosyltransferase [Opitutus sp. GAS368]|uniref:glycosyltransferase n=1 Tax=Opitutus sp. GAS368 TaxID=1882749 RepID=UPI00087986D0|nr:glycosyltransferase [Opitutus sp. GAS368]SDS26661.1 Glycosyltransferase involved in cell wall bisynthesis [Opitutus sp. GAS368]
MKSPPDKRRALELPQRVLFLNDVGFQYGAGVAQARQVETLLALGIEVGVFAWATGNIDLKDVATRPIDPDLWRGIREINALEGGKKLSDASVIAGILMEVARFNPAIIIIGNLHAANWPFSLLPALREIGCRVIAFLHDAYLYTGRCAYPGGCELYLTGCNATCPTADQYPKLEPARIAGAWQIRRDIFGGPNGVEVVANSDWSNRMFRTALPACRSVETIHLGADELVFKPGDKAVARKILGLPGDKPVVLSAAVNFQEPRKGGRQLREIAAALQNTCTFAAFGHNAHEVPGLIGLGYHLQADKIAMIYQAADIFLGTATEEAFGQTLMEAQLCGLPVVAFKTGGVDEIVRHEITGLLVSNGNAAEAVAAIQQLLGDALFLANASAWARQYAVSRFSQWAHELGWHHFLVGLGKTGTGFVPPRHVYPLNDRGDNAAHFPSWPVPSAAGVFINVEHREIYEKTKHLPGWQSPGDAFKLYEMGYHAGDVILEIGTYGGRSATAELRGALANPARTARPQFYGIDIEASSIARTRGTLADECLSDYCHLFHGTLQDFVQRWDIAPTMVFLDGDHSYEGVMADLATLSRYLRPGTPVLVHDFLNPDNATGAIGVRRAVEEWARVTGSRFTGCFGDAALYLTAADSAPRT